MTRLLLVIFYSFRYIYWALIEFFTAFGKKLRVQGSVESVTAQPAAMGLDQVCIRYKYKVNGRTYSGSLMRECSHRNTTWKLLQRFPLGRGLGPRGFRAAAAIASVIRLRVRRTFAHPDPRDPPPCLVVLVGPPPRRYVAPLHAVDAICSAD